MREADKGAGDRRVSIRLPEGDYRRISAAAADSGRPVSEYMRMLMQSAQSDRAPSEATVSEGLMEIEAYLDSLLLSMRMMHQAMLEEFLVLYRRIPKPVLGDDEKAKAFADSEEVQDANLEEAYRKVLALMKRTDAACDPMFMARFFDDLGEKKR